MAAEEPLYCSQCGAEDFHCNCHEERPTGPFCPECGIIPAKGWECRAKSGTKNFCRAVADVNRFGTSREEEEEIEK